MTRTLILTRHAKSSWDDPRQDDHDRPLNNRGRKSAKAIGDWLRAQGHVPDAGLSSTSLRTRETWGGLGFDVPVTFDEALYHAGPETIFRVLQRATVPTVLLLGHNPGIGAFAERIVGTPPDHARFLDYPTCATLVVRFDTDDWRTITWGSGDALEFVIPRELLA